MEQEEPHGQRHPQRDTQRLQGNTTIHIGKAKHVTLFSTGQDCTAGHPHGETTSQDCNGNRSPVTNPSQQNFRLLMVGKTGSGKSSTGNTILGEERFLVKFTATSVTKECSKWSTNLQDGRFVQVVDTPGLFDNRKTAHEVAAIILRAVAGMHPGPHAILYVVQLGSRYTEEESNSLTRLKTYLAPDITKYMIVVFTHGDELAKSGETMGEYLKNIPDQLKAVLEECGYRYVVFDNKEGEKEPQVTRLLDRVEAMLKESEGQHYTSDLTELVGDKLEKEITKRVQEAGANELEDNKYVKEILFAKGAAERSNKSLKKLCAGVGCSAAALLMGAAVATPFATTKLAAAGLAVGVAKIGGAKVLSATGPSVLAAGSVGVSAVTINAATADIL